MAAVVVALAPINALTIDPDTGAVQLIFANNQGQGWNSEADFRQWIVDNATDAGEPAKTAAQAILVGHLLAKDPLLNSLSDWNSKKITIDAEQADPADVVKVV